MPADDAELEVHLLQFVLKSFAHERNVAFGGREFAIFQRTETESESQFRPRLVKLRVVLPRDWVLYDIAADALLIARDGVTPGSRGSGSAVEEGAEKSEFREQGVEWKKSTLSRLSMAYVPKELEGTLLSTDGRAALGLD
jgi:hypothetical protein